MKIFSQYSGVATVFQRYWRHYGGASAVFMSPYFHVAVGLTAVLYPYWLHNSWWDLAINTIPGLLGFSLGGFAIWLAFGDRGFRSKIGTRAYGDASSAYMKVSAAFAHFIALQIFALFAAIVAKATQFSISPIGAVGQYIPRGLATFVVEILAPTGHFIGFLLFCYALLSALAASMAVFRVASWFDFHLNDSVRRNAARERRSRWRRKNAMKMRN